VKRNNVNPKKEWEKTLGSMLNNKNTFVPQKLTAKQLQKDSPLRMIMYYLNSKLKK